MQQRTKTSKGFLQEPFLAWVLQRLSLHPSLAVRTVLGFVLPSCGLLMPAPVLASDQNQVRGEIVALLHVVEHCGCSFLRNGTWHSSAEARRLLEHKANDAMRDPTIVPSAEQFITKLATRSSMSGKPYMVRCGEAKSVESGPWLMAKLVELRATATPAPRTTAPR